MSTMSSLRDNFYYENLSSSKIFCRLNLLNLGPVSSRLLFRRFVILGLVLVTVFIWKNPLNAQDRPVSFANLAEQLLPAVVNISTLGSASDNGTTSDQRPQFQFPPGSPFEDLFRDFLEKQPQRRRSAMGSGFIIDSSGIVVTNNHVIQDAEEITVTLHDKTQLKATLVGRHPKTHLAVLKVKPTKKLPFVSFGDSKKLRVGDWVMAIGNPFGLGGSVTAGIVSARGRNIGSGPYDDFIQTDASINRGNSGGPLFNLSGEVVGINTAIFSPTGGSVGIGFSIPSSAAELVINQLRTFGRTKRGWLGVRIQQVTDEIAKSLGLKEVAGALVAEVTKNSPATGKIRQGDIILTFNGQKVKAMRNLPGIVANTEIGKRVPVVVWRNGRKVSISISVGELKEEQVTKVKKSPAITAKAKELKIPQLGLAVAKINQTNKKRFGLKNNAKGVVITSVDPKGPAASKRLTAGQTIIAIDQTEIITPRDIERKIKSAIKAGRTSVLILRDSSNGPGYIAVPFRSK